MGADVNQALSSLHDGSLDITLIVPFISQIFQLDLSKVTFDLKINPIKNLNINKNIELYFHEHSL